MQHIQIQDFTKASHNAQILTGLHCLAQNGEYAVTVLPVTMVKGAALVKVGYRGKTLIYDTNDGYFDAGEMIKLLRKCDFYFKRSFCAEKNEAYFGELSRKIYPLGFNYHVTYPGNPLNSTNTVKERIKKLLGLKTDASFISPVFEAEETVLPSNLRIMFYTRLWPHEPALPEYVNQERDQINNSRIEILRQLRKRYGSRFDGGVEKSSLALQMCPDLVLPKRKTRRWAYLKRMHRCHICIGSVGLYGSVGWKTGEYIAAGKAVVLEKTQCSFPGEFLEQKNYLSFESVEECLSSVERLVMNQELCRAMMDENKRYYELYLKPDALIRNTLHIVDAAID